MNTCVCKKGCNKAFSANKSILNKEKNYQETIENPTWEPEITWPIQLNLKAGSSMIGGGVWSWHLRLGSEGTDHEHLNTTPCDFLIRVNMGSDSFFLKQTSVKRRCSTGPIKLLNCVPLQLSTKPNQLQWDGSPAESKKSMHNNRGKKSDFYSINSNGNRMASKWLEDNLRF